MNIFDIIGPVMIGPSSSHTAGAVRLGRVAWLLLEDEPAHADIQLAGSFAQTGSGHGTDRALVAGCMGMKPDDEHIRDSFRIAEEHGFTYTFSTADLPEAHPNTAVIGLSGKKGNRVTVEGASIGGGNIRVESVNGMDVEFSGQNTTILVRHLDKPGAIAAVTNFMAYSSINISNFRLSRKKKGGEALMMIETDGTVPPELEKQLRLLPNVLSVIVLYVL